MVRQRSLSVISPALLMSRKLTGMENGAISAYSAAEHLACSPSLLKLCQWKPPSLSGCVQTIGRGVLQLWKFSAIQHIACPFCGLVQCFQAGHSELIIVGKGQKCPAFMIKTMLQWKSMCIHSAICWCQTPRSTCWSNGGAASEHNCLIIIVISTRVNTIIIL
jgi:hypothetical protein